MSSQEMKMARKVKDNNLLKGKLEDIEREDTVPH